ncbi:MAG TPA: NADH-ubiquinone oxidoreductase-F iron-sulfur binding region domain-containing protein [Candidatus Dormibacteraeota bacterium]|nr:NADH-ubiquinone oxidoreductase-F iron-sulfur binding region domain-containing protein [Candidatus Dormibacteraeota bacterium]
MRLLDAHSDLGPLPQVGRGFIDALERSGLAGRGGAGFSTATKWRAVGQRSRGDAVILVNGAEGEPQSKKDRVLMTAQPHLVLDGAFVAARVLRARRIVLYIGERHQAARAALARALERRPEPELRLVTFAAAPARYVAGAEAAAVHLVNEGFATPTTVPPYPFERGVDGAPTLVQNVETLAHVAVLARTGSLPGTMLLTFAGGVDHAGVVEAQVGTTIGDAVAMAGGPSSVPRAVLVGGYFGRWMRREEAWQLPLTPAAVLGCGVIGLLPEGRCPVCDTAEIMSYLAGESSAQCGPCFFGLRALADACTRIAEQGSNPGDLERLHRWAAEVRGRGACKHPDGAGIFLSSALSVFAADFAAHAPHVRWQSA